MFWRGFCLGAFIRRWEFVRTPSDETIQWRDVSDRSHVGLMMIQLLLCVCAVSPGYSRYTADGSETRTTRRPSALVGYRLQLMRTDAAAATGRAHHLLARRIRAVRRMPIKSLRMPLPSATSGARWRRSKPKILICQRSNRASLEIKIFFPSSFCFRNSPLSTAT